MWFWSILFVLMTLSLWNAPVRFFMVIGIALVGGIFGDGNFWNWMVGCGTAAAFILQPFFWAWFGGGFYLGKNGFTFPWNLK